jgi:hypothetical protein
LNALSAASIYHDNSRIKPQSQFFCEKYPRWNLEWQFSVYNWITALRGEVKMMGMNKIISTTLLVGVLAAALAGCASARTTPTEAQPSDQGQSPEPPATEEVPELPTIEPSETPLVQSPTAEPTGEVPSEILDEITADLIKRTGAQRGDIQLVKAEAVVWNDASLGCPKPGEFYIQILVEGYWVVLQVEGVEYDYRASDSGNFILCEGNNMPPITTPETGEQTENPLVMQAKEDLADRLKVRIDQIDLLKVVQAKWPYDSIGCPLPNGVTIDTSTPGYQILLNANDEQYLYHTDGKDWVVPCVVKPPNEIRTLP